MSEVRILSPRPISEWPASLGLFHKELTIVASGVTADAQADNALRFRTSTRISVLMLKWLMLAVFAALLFYGWRHRQRHLKRSAVDRLVRCTRCHRYLSVRSAVCRGQGDYRCPQHAGEDQ